MHAENIRKSRDNTVVSMYNLSDSMILDILLHLEVRDVLSVMSTCRRWRNIGSDELLWRNLIYRTWGADCSKTPLTNSWLEEYRRLYCHVPYILSEELVSEHKDEIYHVTFSHDGKLFSTTGRDCTVKVWEVGCPTKLKYSYNLQEQKNWRKTRYSAFNQGDTSLLVSGDSFYEEIIAKFSLVDDFVFTWQHRMSPLGLRGAWLSNNLLLYGEQSDTGKLVNLYTESVETEESKLFLEIKFKARVQMEFLNVVRRTHVLTENGIEQDILYSDKQNMLVFSTGYCDYNSQIGITYIPDLGLRSEIAESSFNECQKANCDHLIDIRGQILGMKVSLDSRYMVVNIQRWLEEPEGSDLYKRSELSKNMEIRLVDLVTLQVEPIVYTGHKSDTGAGYGYCFGDAGRDFVVCGSGTHQAYIWDRHSGVLLSTLEHLTGVSHVPTDPITHQYVNAAAINPVDQEYVVTAGDDHVVRVLRSRNKHREFERTKPTSDIQVNGFKDGVSIAEKLTNISGPGIV